MPGITPFQQPWSDIMSSLAQAPQPEDPAVKIAQAMQGWSPEMQQRAQVAQRLLTNRPFDPAAFAQRQMRQGVSPMAFGGFGGGGEGGQGPAGFAGQGNFGDIGFGWGGALKGALGGAALGPLGMLGGALLGGFLGGDKKKDGKTSNGGYKGGYGGGGLTKGPTGTLGGGV